MSDSLQPHGLPPTKLLCPWDFPGANTRVDCHFLLRGSFPPSDQTHISYICCIGSWIFTTEPTGKPIWLWCFPSFFLLICRIYIHTLWILPLLLLHVPDIFFWSSPCLFHFTVVFDDLHSCQSIFFFQFCVFCAFLIMSNWLLKFIWNLYVMK